MKRPASAPADARRPLDSAEGGESEISVRPLLVSIEGAAEILAISRTSVYQLIWNEELIPVRIGRCLRFSIAQLERFVDDR